MDESQRPEFNIIKPCRYGTMIFNKHDTYIGRALDLYGEFSPEEGEFFTRLLKPGDVVIEAGANIGAFTLPIAKAIEPNGFVLALEPQRLAFQLLCGNMAINNVSNAICMPFAAGERPGSIRVPALDPSQPHNFGSLELGGERPGETAQLLALDMIPLPKLTLLKVDVEGMETPVLKGAKNLIQKYKPVICVEDDRPEKSPELQALVRSLGYMMFEHLPPMYSPSNFRNNPENVFPNRVSRNLLCFPEGSDIKAENLRKL